MRKQRLESIAEYINNHGLVSFSILCNEFSTSSATMRRDLSELEQCGMIERIHGGAKSLQLKPSAEPPFQKRLMQNIDEKRRIAKYALSTIQENDVIILDSSTTTLELAKLISEVSMNIMVITNDVYMSYIIQSNPSIELIMIGGHIRHNFYTTLGMFAETMIRQVHADKLFLGVDALSLDFGAMNYQVDEISCKRIMITNSRQCTILCDHTKFSSSALLQLCPLTNIHAIITGTELNDESFAAYNSHYKDLSIVRV